MLITAKPRKMAVKKERPTKINVSFEDALKIAATTTIKKKPK